MRVLQVARQLPQAISALGILALWAFIVGACCAIPEVGRDRATPSPAAQMLVLLLPAGGFVAGRLWYWGPAYLAMGATPIALLVRPHYEHWHLSYPSSPTFHVAAWTAAALLAALGCRFGGRLGMLHRRKLSPFGPAPDAEKSALLSTDTDESPPSNR